MAKTKNPLLSLGAHGTLANAVTFRESKGQNIMSRKLQRKDAHTDTQQSWRTMVEMAIALWHDLSVAERRVWNHLAAGKNMTGYNLFLSQALRPNPGIYLPLLGGTMQGAIAMANHAITDMPNPLNLQDADTKAARNTAIATHADLEATHGVADTIAGLADITDHAANLSAHTKNWLETLMTGVYLLTFPVMLFDILSRPANYLCTFPLLVARNMTIDRIAVEVTATGTATAIRLGIYNNGVNLIPNTLLLDAGTIDPSTTGVKYVTVNQALTKGLYHLCYLLDGTATLRTASITSPYGLVVNNFAALNESVYVPQAYGALPNPFPAGETISHGSLVAIRIASLD